jgi:hypothetical protein
MKAFPLPVALLILICGLQVSFSTPQKKSSLYQKHSDEDTLVTDEYYLDMRGRVLEFKGQQKSEDRPALPNALVSVTNEAGKTVIDGICDNKGRLSFKLPLNRRFMMHISKAGYVEKKVIVDTHVPLNAHAVYQFTFDLDIFEHVDGLNVSILNKPIARISFKPFDKKFVYDREYTNKVNNDLQKMYREYYALKRKEQKLAADTTAKTKTQVKGNKQPLH